MSRGCPDHAWLTLGTIWQGAVYVVEQCPRCDQWRRQRLAACDELSHDEHASALQE